MMDTLVKRIEAWRAIWRGVNLQQDHNFALAEPLRPAVMAAENDARVLAADLRRLADEIEHQADLTYDALNDWPVKVVDTD